VCNPVPGYSTIALSSQPLLLPGTGTVNQRLLVIIMDYSPCSLSPSISEATVRTIFLGSNGDGKSGVARTYTRCSHGKLNLNSTAFKVVVVRNNCTASVTKSCAYWDIAKDGDTRAKELLGDVVFSSFTNRAYILPPGMNMVCPWPGLALVPGTQMWLQTSAYGVYQVSTIMQQTVHNYGLWHSWQNGWEYADRSTPMGTGNTCLNAPEMAYMGWATPAPGGGRIDSEALPVGTALTFSLPATYLSPEENYIRVAPDWLTSYRSSSVATNLYIAVRVNKSGDALLPSFYANKVNIHEVNASLDNNWSSTSIYTDRKISFISAVTPFSRANMIAYKIIVYGGSWVGGKDVLRVHLCRYRSSPDECPSLNFLEARTLPPPRPPKPPSPTPPSLPPRPSPPLPPKPRSPPSTRMPPRPPRPPPPSPTHPPPNSPPIVS
ncbi:hypothetical protein VOLCADRAFT_66631, partial [Volvox carteri f. nagariensis]